MVLTRMFGATETLDSRPNARRFELPDGAKVILTGDQWQELRLDQGQWSKGKGAINLVMQLSGYGQEHYQQAVRDMAEVFSDSETTTSLKHYLTENANWMFSSMKRGQYQKPPASDEHWPGVRESLLEQTKLPTALIDQAHEAGLIYSDRRKNCVFLCGQNNGAYISNTKGKAFYRRLGQGGNPYVLPGSDKAVYITDTLLEALSLKATHPKSTILATEGLLNRDKLKPYLEGRAEVILAQGRGKSSEELAQFLAQNFPQARRLSPERGQSWHEELLLQREEKERAQRQALSLESNKPQAGPVERADEPLKPTAGMWR